MKDKYNNPVSEIQDLAGVRIIAYVNSDVKKICNIIEREFDVDNSENKTEKLGTDKVGYMSIHYVAKFNKERECLPEYSSFKGLCFEIQVRTLLQHAWAEIEHDRNYKFGGVLPKEILRKFSLVSGMLEMADIQFDEISSYIDKYAEEVSRNTQIGKLEGILIDSTSLQEYMDKKFKKYVDMGLIDQDFNNINDKEQTIIKELNMFDIFTLNQLDKIIDGKITDQFFEGEYQNYVGLLRDYMMICDSEKYFNKSWNENWHGIDLNSIKVIEKFNPGFNKIFKKYDIDVLHK